MASLTRPGVPLKPFILTRASNLQHRGKRKGRGEGVTGRERCACMCWSEWAHIPRAKAYGDKANQGGAACTKRRTAHNEEIERRHTKESFALLRSRSQAADK